MTCHHATEQQYRPPTEATVGREAHAAPRSPTTPHTSPTQCPAARSTQRNQDRTRTMTAPRYDVDAIATVEEYLDRSDWRVNANANQGVFAGRPDPEFGGQDRRQLLARTRLHPRDRRAAPRGRLPHPRPRHVRRILRRLVAQAPDPGGLQRRGRRDCLGPAQALLLGLRPDRQLPRNPPERVGGRPGLLLLRHLHGPPSCAWTTWSTRTSCSACRSSSTT